MYEMMSIAFCHNLSDCSGNNTALVLHYFFVIYIYVSDNMK